jgi:hypothetical protein
MLQAIFQSNQAASCRTTSYHNNNNEEVPA